MSDPRYNFLLTADEAKRFLPHRYWKDVIPPKAERKAAKGNAEQTDFNPYDIPDPPLPA